MALVNPDWINSDKHADHLITAGLWTGVSDDVDAQLYQDCQDRGITIPVDGSGFIDSQYLQAIARFCALWLLFDSATGIRDSNTDIYREKAMRSQQMYLNNISKAVESKV